MKANTELVACNLDVVYELKYNGSLKVIKISADDKELLKINEDREQDRNERAQETLSDICGKEAYLEVELLSL